MAGFPIFLMIMVILACENRPAALKSLRSALAPRVWKKRGTKVTAGKLLTTADESTAEAIAAAATELGEPFTILMARSASLTMLYRAASPDSYIIATLDSDALSAKLEAYNAGADLVMVEPYSVQELGARILAAGRRAYGSMKSDLIIPGILHLDVLNREVWNLKTGAGIPMRPLEFNILWALMASPTKCLSYPKLRGMVYGRLFDRQKPFPIAWLRWGLYPLYKRLEAAGLHGLLRKFASSSTARCRHAALRIAAD